MSVRHRLAAVAVLGFLALGACGDFPPTEPKTVVEPPSADFAVAANSWTRKADMPTGRYEFATAVRNNSSGQPILYAIGGLLFSGGQFRDLSKVEAYNFATNSWSTKASLPVHLYQTNGAGLISGKIYVSGGWTLTSPGEESRFSNALFVYDPPRNTWTKRANLPRPVAMGITGVINGKLYVLTGYCDPNECVSKYTRRLYRYDPVANSWNTSLPAAPRYHIGGAGGVINGKFYVVGGRGTGQSTNQLDVYDPASNTWSSRAPMPTARDGAAAAVHNGKLYVIGGRDVNAGWLRTVEVYDPVSNAWTTKAPMPTERTDLGAGRVSLSGSSYIMAVGGAKNGMLGLKTNEAYLP
jgi:N-acetylneuraminic acid mutarotase